MRLWIIKNVFWKISSVKVKVSRWFDENLPIEGSLLFVFMTTLTYLFTYYYIKKQEGISSVLTIYDIKISTLLPLFIALVCFYLSIVFSIYGAAKAVRGAKLRHLLRPMCGFILVDYYVFRNILEYDNLLVHFIPLLFSCVFLLWLALVRRNDFDTKIKYNQTLRCFTGVRKKKKIKILHPVEYKYLHKTDKSEKQFVLKVEWALERYIDDDSYLDSIIDYDHEGKQFTHKLERKAYDLLECNLVLNTVDRSELTCIESDQVFENMEFMRSRGWTLPSLEHYKLLIFSTYLMRIMSHNKDREKEFDDFLNTHFSVLEPILANS